MVCPNCGHVYPIKDGVPNMLLAEHELWLALKLQDFFFLKRRILELWTNKNPLWLICICVLFSSITICKTKAFYYEFKVEEISRQLLWLAFF